MTPELRQILQQCDAQGVRLELNAEHKIVLKGDRPDDALRAQLREHRDPLREHLKTSDHFRNRWGECPAGSLRYLPSPPVVPADQLLERVRWVQRQPFPVHKWVADRANAYYAKRPDWTQEQMDHAAILDLYKWQTGNTEWKLPATV